MNLLVLGKGKTGSLVAEVARERGHQVRALDAAENANASALTKDGLRGVDVVLDFTTPQAVVPNIEACAKMGASMVDRKSTRLNSSHIQKSRMPSSA